mgnify:CR=1 FL=1
MKRRVLVQGALAGSASLLQGCSPLRLINGLVLPGTYRLQAGIGYGSHARMKRDVYRAGDGRTATQVPAPVVVFCYSGNWHSGERADYLFVGAALVAQGFVAVLPGDRLYPEVRFPDFWVFRKSSG